MDLSHLLAATAEDPAFTGAETHGETSVVVNSVAYDSRRVEPGALFCCVPGLDVDGHRFAADAVARGAVALLCEEALDLDVPQIRVPSVRAAMGPLAAIVAGRPSDDLVLVGITGTNGKTTTAHLLVSIFEGAGWPAAVIGTLTGARTTPEAPDLQVTLAGHASAGVRAVAMEVSSHALDQRRVNGCRFAVSVFTNLGNDHLDYHRDLDSYFRAKARLFAPQLSARAVVNLDDVHGRLLSDAAQIPTGGYSMADATDVVVGSSGTRFRWQGETVDLPLSGRFNVSNALAAASAAAALGIDASSIAAGLSSGVAVPGRFERIESDAPFTVVVDYAHTPDGLALALGAARELVEGGRLIVVFGCGGDRDRLKRPSMGRIATERADEAVLTSDNPRSERPMAIIEDVTAGVVDRSKLSVVPDRSKAIHLAIDRARPGDVVLVAGKGHETHQIIGEEAVAFDDRQVARAALASREATS